MKVRRDFHTVHLCQVQVSTLSAHVFHRENTPYCYKPGVHICRDTCRYTRFPALFLSVPHLKISDSKDNNHCGRRGAASNLHLFVSKPAVARMCVCGSTQIHVSAQCALLLETPKWFPLNLEAYCPLCISVAIGDKI